MRHSRFITLILLTVFLITAGFGCKGGVINTPSFKPINLSYWGVWDTPQQMRGLIDAYEATHPTIQVEYKNFRLEEYEQKLDDALWEDRLPDVFAIPVTWLKKYQDRLEPMPQTVKIPVKEVTGTIKKEEITTLKTINSLSTSDIKRQYVGIVEENVILDGKIYGLPYSMDTLVTFYNLDLLTQAGIAEPIVDFHDLVEEQTPKLSKIGEANQIYQSAVALGGTDNIPRFFDILSSIMMQYDVEVKGKKFDPAVNKTEATRLAQVFDFYTSFANPAKATFSWDASLPNAFEMFAQGKLAYFFGYSYHADELRQRGVQFDWDITNFPQTQGAQGTKYYANYWVNVVPKKSKNTDAAWNFIQTTAGELLVKNYLSTNKKPTALRSLIDEQLQDDDIRVFASQSLTADNWYNGYDINLAEKNTADFINDLVSGELILDSKGETVGLFVKLINQTYIKPE